jgi:hypothetical protein
MNLMKVCFVGAYNRNFDATNVADSPAGNQVQSKIAEELAKFYGKDSFNTISFNPQKFWPYGPLIVCTKRYEDGISFGFLNIPMIKTILFSLRLFGYLYKENIDIVVKYNVSLSEAIILRLFKFLNKNTFICVIIQDVNYPQSGFKIVYGLFEWCAVRMCGKFDFIVPVTVSIINDFKLPTSKALVFNGGITRQTEALISEASISQQLQPERKFAVFAGALEKYNGIDLLLNEWIKSEIGIELHVFGKGSLSKNVSLAAASCKFIIYHGFVSEEEVSRWQIASAFNICLRYPIGINQNYFFPSKFFNLVAAQGIVVSNDFINFPESLKPCCSIVDDNLSNLNYILKYKLVDEWNNNRQERLKWLNENCKWSSVIVECNKRYNSIINRALN